MPALYEIIQFRPRSIVIYPYYERTKSKAYYREKNARLRAISELTTKHDLTKESNKTKGRLSDLSIRRLRYAIQLLAKSSPWQFIQNETIKEGYQFKLGFLTLTLPCAQGSISDETIKRTALMPFITALQKKFGKFSYVWKAETQDNGNIHFHLTINAWIHYSSLRYYWNRRLAALGYIDEYRREQMAFHAKGFRPRPELFETWSLEQQGKAYDNGMRTNWTNPNTTDIHSVERINDLAAYLIKYMSKKEEGKREIKGKIWGCSQNLSYNNKFELILDGMILNTDQSLQTHFQKIDIGTDYVTVLKMDKSEFEVVFPDSVKAAWNEFLRKTYLNE